METIFQSLDQFKDDFFRLEKERDLPWIYASAAITMNGMLNSKRKPLGGEVDREWYHFLISQADEIILGATTLTGGLNADRYKGKEISVLSNSLNLDLDSFPVKGSGLLNIYYQEETETVNVKGKEIEKISASNRVIQFDSVKDIISRSKEKKILIDGGGQIYTLFAPLIQDWFVTVVPRFASTAKTPLWQSDLDSPELDLKSAFPTKDRLLCRFEQD